MNADRFLLTVYSEAGSLNARTANENQARVLMGMMVNNPSIKRMTLHEETKKGLKLLLEIGEVG